MNEVTFDRPVAGKLVVQLANGEFIEPTPDDLLKFDLVTRKEANANFRKHLLAAMSMDKLDPMCQRLDEGDISMLRYFAERCVLYCGDEGLGDFTCSDDDETYADMHRVLKKLTGWWGGAADDSGSNNEG